MEPQEKEGTIIALGELIQQLGGKPSKSDLKVFSTPSAESKGSAPDARGPMSTMKSAEGGLGQAAGRQRDRTRDQNLGFGQASCSGEALRQEKADSEVGGEKSLAAALEEQTRVLKEALSSRGSSSTVTAVKTDLSWPTLGDERADTKDVALFYEELENFARWPIPAKGCRL